MKRFLPLLMILITSPTWAGMVIGSGATSYTCSGSNTYFGNLTETGSFNQTVSGSVSINNNITFTAPGSGTLQVCELSMRAKSFGGTPGHIRVAIYDTSNNLLCQGTAEVTVSSTTVGWVGHMVYTDITPNPCNITGGTNYRLARTVDAGTNPSDTMWQYQTGTTGDYQSKTTDYTGGFPATLTGLGNTAEKSSVRAGVQ